MALSIPHGVHTPRVASSASPWPGLLSLGVGSAAAFVPLAILAARPDPGRFDVWAIHSVQRADAPGLAPLVKYLGLSTGAAGAVAAWTTLMLILAVARWWVPAAVALFLPFGGVINAAVATLVDRHRPHLSTLRHGSWNPEPGAFPSGHVQGAVMLYGLLLAMSGRIGNRPLRWSVRCVSVFMIVAVGPARVWTGAHWPTDVIGGYLLAAVMLVPMLWALTRLDEIELLHHSNPWSGLRLLTSLRHGRTSMH